MLRIHEIKLNIGEGTELLPRRIIKKLNMKGLELAGFQVVRESVDARDKAEIKRVYAVDFAPSLPGKTAEEAEALLLERCRGVKLEKAPDLSYQPPVPGQAELAHRPIIAGFGPCGMFAALILAEMGYRPIILERGREIAQRVRDVDRFWREGILDPDSNVQFGEGGAGLFSDGKLTTQIRDPRVRKVLEEFVEAGADAEILYKQKPHIGTDILRKVVFNIRKKVLEKGGEILFQSKLSDLVLEGASETKKLRGVVINGEQELAGSVLVLAVGHSARDTFRMLNQKGIPMEQKPFSMGVRIEHPQALINEAQYGQGWEACGLGAADYKLSHRCGNGRGVYTFCMCPGGYVVGAASMEGGVVTNGMSYHDRGSANANSALLVDVRTEDFPGEAPLAGMELQEQYERLAFQAGGGNYRAPAQRLKDFMEGTSRPEAETPPGPDASEAKTPAGPDAPEAETPAGLGASESGLAAGSAVAPTYRPGVTWTDLSQCLPPFAVEAMREAIPVLGRKLRGFDSGEAILTGVETRSSSPVRIPRDPGLMSGAEGLYPAGEGAGYAGGILSAAADGIRAAEEIVKKYKRLPAE